jgi:selenide, water dikinase
MMQLPTSISRDLVLIGGGHTHALVLRMWGMSPLPGVRLTLISPDPDTAYSGMLPGHIAGHYPREALQIDLVKLARFAGARLVLGRAEGLDRDKRLVQVTGRAPIAYDLASIDIGITSAMPSLPGFDAHATPAKPLDAFADSWANFVCKVASGLCQPSVAVIGGGLAGVELALAARHRLGPTAQVTVIEARQPLAEVGHGARRALLRHLDQAGIKVAIGAAKSVSAEAVELETGQVVQAAFVIGSAAAQAQGWLTTTGLALEGGFLRITPTLQSETDPLIFGAGDIVHMGFAPRPKAGVFAVRQAPVLLHNLRAAVSNIPSRMRNYSPQKDYLKLISTGSKNAVADKWGLPLDGRWLWRWKDRIDRRFIDRFHQLPAMAAPPDPSGQNPADKPLCGGCGAKIGRPALLAALDGLPVPARADVVVGAGDDAAILRHGTGFQVITTDHLRGFCEDPWLMARITAIHALGDVWSMGAAPQTALAQITLPPMDERQQAETLREIMAAATEVFGAEGADIVGGHSNLGAELSIGFTVTGLSDQLPTGHGGAVAGNRLILTKAIGTGIILAAEMQGQARGRDVANAYRAMSRPQGTAARLLAPHARAMTDVTGFGLAGHLLTILQASNLSARLDLGAVPVLTGAEELAAIGHGSSLLPANLQARGLMTYHDSPKATLLFDPQTAGGLLAAVPADKADEILSALIEAGETAAAIIGQLGAGPAGITVLG